MKLITYYRSLDSEAREAFAEMAGTSKAYIETHLMAHFDRRKTPRRELMVRITEATEGNCSYEEVIAHFFGEMSSDEVREAS